MCCCAVFRYSGPRVAFGVSRMRRAYRCGTMLDVVGGLYTIVTELVDWC